MPGEISFTFPGTGRYVGVRRDLNVPDDFWGKLRSEWGQKGIRPSAAIQIPIETFIGRKAWLAGSCKEFGVQVLVDPGVRSLLEQSRHDQVSLDDARSHPIVIDAAETMERIAGTRFVRQLKDFQVRDLGKLLSLAHGANFSVPGAGKTSVELAIFEAERASNRVSQLLVIGPLSSFDAWVQDSRVCLSPTPLIYKYGGGSIPAFAEVVLVNYQRLANSFDELANWVTQNPTLIVLDEAHRMKRGWDGEWGRACLELAFLAKRRDVLTGTPAPQSPRDLIALIDFLWPGRALRVLPHEALTAQPSPQEVSLVTPAIAPLFVRTTKHELDLPAIEMQVVPVPMGKLHAEIYASLKADFSKLVKSQRERTELASWGEITMYLLEAATNPALLPAGSSSDDPIEFRHPPLSIPDGSSLRELIAQFASYETPEKFVQIALMVRQLTEQGRKVLIWSNFVRNLITLERMFRVYEPALIHGGIPSELTSPLNLNTRENELIRFREDDNCKVLLANPAALGEGVSLHQMCHDAIYLERSFNAGQYLQSVDRIHRLGLEKGQRTTVTFLISTDTIDEAVSSRISIKARRLGVMLDDPGIETMSLPDEEDVGQPIDTGDDGDIAALFAHLRGEVNVGE